MKVVILLLALTLGLSHALKCYGCSGNDCERPLDNQRLVQCSPREKFCVLKSVNGKIDFRDCSHKTELSEDYKAVEGYSNRTCKIFKMQKVPSVDDQKECLCEGDLCNTSNPSALASLTLITSLLITKAIFM